MPIKIAQPKKSKFSFFTGILVGIFSTLFLFVIYTYVINNPSFIYQTGIYHLLGRSAYVQGKILVTVPVASYNDAVVLFLENAESSRLMQYASNDKDSVFEVSVPVGQEEKWIQLYRNNSVVKTVDFEYQKLF